jgi:hypothetical protein
MKPETGLFFKVTMKQQVVLSPQPTFNANQQLTQKSNLLQKV